jgi:hypothetical protein
MIVFVDVPPMPCGCVITMGQNRLPTVAFCRKHAAADELLEALHDIIEQADRTDAGAWYRLDAFKTEVCRVAKEVIAKATPAP